MRYKTILTILTVFVCALSSGAQTLTATYLQLADSADYYMRHERWADAERNIVKALKHEPANKSNYLLWNNLGSVRTSQGDYDGALQAYEIGLASAPKSTILLSNRARTYLARGDVKEAMADLDRALELDSTLQWPRKMRGILRGASGDIAGALKDLNQYTARFGNDPAVSETLGDISLAQGDQDTALARYKEAYDGEHDAQLLTKLLVTASDCGKLEEYEPLLHEGMKEYPSEGNLYLMRALLNKLRYQNSAMERDLKSAAELGADETLRQQLLPEKKK